MSILHVELPKWMRGDGALMRNHAALAARPTSGDTASDGEPVSVGAEAVAPGDTVTLFPGNKVRLGDAVLQFCGLDADNNLCVQLYSESQARHLDCDSVEAERERQRPPQACHV